MQPAAHSTERRCFARVARRCRESEGLNAQAERWHAVSGSEAFCSDCLTYYSGGAGRRAAAEFAQAHGRCSVKDMVPRLHLPVYVQCETEGCGKWRPLPALTVPSSLSDGWHCGLWDSSCGRGRRRPGRCEMAEDRSVGLPAPPEPPDAPVPQLVPTSDVAALQASALDARLPWWELSPSERALYIGTPLAHAPRLALALRNLLLLLWSRDRASGRLSVPFATRHLCASGLTRVWAAASLPPVFHALRRLGWINYAAGAQLSLTIPLSGKGKPAVPLRVVVVGGGLAGLAAARQLRAFGHRPVVLEAQARVGGRVLTGEMGGARVDLGAMLLVGTVGNPLVALCEQLGLRLHTLDRSKCPLYDGESVLDPEVGFVVGVRRDSF
jgi:hypothetical protein